MAHVLASLVVVLGIALMVGLICAAAVAIHAREKGSALLPWGPRGRVERAKAEAEIEVHRLEQQATEIRKLALEPVRAKVLEAIEKGETVDLAELLKPRKELQQQYTGTIHESDYRNYS